ncbi:MAG: hypothetical protein QOE20_340 [Mycobacterium sp.]|nr:hypothetical protein [Mycobacterium sp.]
MTLTPLVLPGASRAPEDPFVSHYVYDAVRNWVPQLWRRDVNAGQWVPMSHPQVLAQSFVELVDKLDGRLPSGQLLRAQVGRP